MERNNSNSNNWQKKIITYEHYLDLALERLFTLKDSKGYWEPQKGRFIKKLDYHICEGKITWTPDETVEFRYGPFGLFGVLYWRFTSLHAKSDYDLKIIRYLDFLRESIKKNGQVDTNGSGWDHALVLICLSLGYLNYVAELPDKAKSYLSNAIKIYNYCAANWNPGNISDNHDLFLIWAYGWLYEALESDKSKAEANTVKSGLKELSDWVCNTQDRSGLFQTGDSKAILHQRIMYSLMGLGKAAKILNEEKYLATIQKSLDNVITCRTERDGAFIWCPLPLKYRLIEKIPFIQMWENPEKGLFFECHQTFFVNAAEQYLQAGGNKDYFLQLLSAIDWIFESNRRRVNLAEECPLKVPWRVMDATGEIHVQGQTFKGCYEIGSYIIALSDLIKRIKQRMREK